MVLSVYIPNNGAGGFPFVHILSSIYCLIFLMVNEQSHHSDWYEVVPHCNFDLNFSNNEWCWEYVCLFAICMSFLEKCLFRSSVLFFIGWFAFFYIELYELFVDSGDLPFVSWFICSYFLSFWGLSIHLVYVSFAM